MMASGRSNASETTVQNVEIQGRGGWFVVESDCARASTVSMEMSLTGVYAVYRGYQPRVHDLAVAFNWRCRFTPSLIVASAFPISTCWIVGS